MHPDDAAAGGRGLARRWRRPRIRLRRPTGIRNGGLLLLLVALAGFMALVDPPVGPRPGRILPGMSQHLPPPVGIFQTPPGGDQAGTAAGVAGAGDGERPTAAARRHPRRVHPRPTAAGIRGVESGLTPGGSAGPGGSGGSGSGGSGSGSPPGTTAPPPAGSVQVRVPAARVRVTPPTVAGQEPPAVEAETPGASVDLPVPPPPVRPLVR
jgi:hypothetical protein